MTLRRHRGWCSSAVFQGLLHILLVAVTCRALPQFPSPPYIATVSELTPIGSILINVTAVPATAGNILTYNIFNYDAAIFGLDSTTGSVFLVGSLDYEQAMSHAFNVEVFEGSEIVMTEITVIVLNENDNPLTCSQTLIVVSLPEGPPPSTPATHLSCVDRDEFTGSVSYHIGPGNDAGKFSVDSDGNVRITSDLDYEQQTQQEVKVNASNANGGGDILMLDSMLLVTILVVVEPVNEYSPTFETNETIHNASESATLGSTIGSVHASDDDDGLDGDLVYSIASQTTPDVFSISSTGQLVLIRSLDYEQEKQNELTIIVRDSSQDATKRQSATATVFINVVNVNEHNPAFTKEVYTVQVSELESSSSEIITLECNDDDSESVLTYSSNDTNHFTIDTFTGIVALVSEIEFDPDAPSVFQLTIQCTDSGGSPTRSALSTLFVEVEGHNRNLPPSVNITEHIVEMSEITSPGSIVVASLVNTVHDGNRGLAGPLQFTLVYDTTCPEDIFQIDSFSGTLYTVAFLDYENSDEYRCIISVSNVKSSASAQLSVFIAVTNENDEVPTCESTLSIISIPPDTAVGTDILTLSCSDADGDILQYSIENNSSAFQLTQTSTLSLQTPVNSDILLTHNINITVSDGLHDIQSQVFVNVEPSNKHIPLFNQSVYNCSVSEIAAIGSMVCTVGATDNDSGQDGKISYRITSENDRSIFAINSESGEVILSGFIDYESMQEYLIHIQACDGGDTPLCSSAEIKITLFDSNDNAPIIIPLITATIAENSEAGSIITSLECSDIDSGPNGDVVLAIESLVSVNAEGIESTEMDIFRIDAVSSKVITNATLDYEESVLYSLSITCTDKGILSLTSSSMIFIHVSPLNEFTPSFSQTNYSATLMESSHVGTSILQVTATDHDKGLDGTVVYSITADDSGINFLQISETSGHITTQQILNCNWGREHVFIITATDRGNPAQSVQSYLRVIFDGCRLGQLTPQKVIYFANVYENSPLNTTVTTVTCDFEKTWREGSPEYNILFPMSSPFQINSALGHISVSTPPNYEQSSSYMLRLSCSDPSSNDESHAIFYVYITILPENEHTPEFTLDTYDAVIAEDMSPGTSVLKVEARDGDSGSDGSVVYAIQENSQHFTVDSRTGVIYTIAFLDRETEGFHTFHIVATDQPAQETSALSTVTEVRVSVLDVNDNRPQCDRIIYHIAISPLVNVGHEVVRIKCTDADSDMNSQLYYTLDAQSVSIDLFALDEQTGDLMLVRMFGVSSAVVHRMSITIEDGGVPSRSTVVLVVVQLQSSPMETGLVTEGDKTPTEVEGSKNLATMTLKDMSTKLWNVGGRESFMTAVAHSLTYYCALLPEACSILSGCAHYYRKRRSTKEYFITAFSEDDVVIQPQSMHEYTSSDGSIQLSVTLYIILPEDTQRTEYRTTDYVIPGTTLAIILEDEGPMIESQVRGSVSPSLTQRDSSSSEKSLCWAWGAVVVALVIVTLSVCVAVIVALGIRKWKNAKKGAKIVPLSVGISSSRVLNSVGTSSDGKQCENMKKRISLRDLAPFTTSTNRVLELNRRKRTPLSEESLQDDVSTIELVDTESANECSLQGRPRSNNSPMLTSSVSGSQSSGKSHPSGSQDSLGDYKQNFPFEPPRIKCTVFHDQQGQIKLTRLQPPALLFSAKTSTVPAWGKSTSHS